jgi:RNA polymerase sigma factor (sigma-70 family)
MGGSRDRFPATRHSVVRELGHEEEARRRVAFDALAAAYWKPVYKYVRVRHGADSESAKDFTQGFFAFAFERESLARFDASRARFRTWVRLCLDRWLVNARQAEARWKRGGRARHLSFDVELVEAELAQSTGDASTDAEAQFEREWMRSLFALALEDLRVASEDTPRDVDFQIFHRYDVLAPESGESLRYEDVAAEFGVPATKVTNALHGMRRRFREALLGRLREICASDEEFHDEARALLGARSS